MEVELAKPKLKILVSSAVYGMEELLDQIYGLLVSFGYEVWMSHKGTVPITSSGTAFDKCLEAVEKCDFLLCIHPNMAVVEAETNFLSHIENCAELLS